MLVFLWVAEIVLALLYFGLGAMRLVQPYTKLVRVLRWLEAFMLERGRNLNVYIVFESLDDLGDIIAAIKAQNAQIYEVELEKGQDATGKRPGAVFFLHLAKHQSHAAFMAAMAEADSIYLMEEL